MQPKIIGLTFATILFFSIPALAGDFDGSKPLICAPVEAMDCTPGQECVKGIPEHIGAPAFMRIDFAKKTVAGPKRASPIQAMENAEGQLLLRGTELGYGWTMVLDHANGKMSATLTDRDGAFVIFGSCTPL